MSRDEHLAWCKERALAELESTEDQDRAILRALASMASDLRKHPETANHPAIGIVALEFFCGGVPTRKKATEYIEGFR